jgi:hypothetical protein
LPIGNEEDVQMNQFSLRPYAYTLAIGALLFFSGAQANLTGTSWIGEPKIFANGTLLCSPDEADKPKWRPPNQWEMRITKTKMKYLPYLQIQKVGAENSGWFRIVESDGCGSFFGFDSDYSEKDFLTGGYLFHRVGEEVWTIQGKKVGTFSDNKLEIFGGGSGQTKFQHLVIELQGEDTVKFYARFTTQPIGPDYPLGTVFEQTAVYKKASAKTK